MKKNPDTLRIGFRGKLMSATELLETLQQELEPLVEPCIHHDRKRAILGGLFRGKRAYCNPKFPTHSRKAKKPSADLKMPPADLVWPAFDLLNLVYWLQAAFERKDLEAVFCGVWYLAERFESFENVKATGKPTFIIRAERHIQRSKGGKNTRKLTPSDAEIATTIFREEKGSRVSPEAAIRRTLTRLKKDHRISIGRTTLYNLVANSRSVKR